MQKRAACFHFCLKHGNSHKDQVDAWLELICHTSKTTAANTIQVKNLSAQQQNSLADFVWKWLPNHLAEELLNQTETALHSVLWWGRSRMGNTVAKVSCKTIDNI